MNTRQEAKTSATKMRPVCDDPPAPKHHTPECVECLESPGRRSLPFRFVAEVGKIGIFEVMQTGCGAAIFTADSKMIPEITSWSVGDVITLTPISHARQIQPGDILGYPQEKIHDRERGTHDCGPGDSLFNVDCINLSRVFNTDPEHDRALVLESDELTIDESNYTIHQCSAYRVVNLHTAEGNRVAVG